MGIDGKQLKASTVADSKLVEDYINSDGSQAMAAALPMGSQKITGLADGTVSTDAVTKGQLDSAVTGLQWRAPVVGNLLGNVQVTGLVGSAAETAIESTSPAAGDSYVVSSLDGDSNIGGDVAVAIGDIVQWSGSAWAIALAHSTNLPPAAAYGLMHDTETLVGTGFSGYSNGDLVDFDGATLYGSSSASAAGHGYVVGDNGSATTADINEGDFIEYSGTAWVELVSNSGGFIPTGTRAITGLEPPFVLIAPYTDATDDGKIVDFDGAGNTGSDTSEATDTSSLLFQDPGHVGIYDNLGYVFEGTVPTGSWIQFTGAGQINAGAGLDKSGNTIFTQSAEGSIAVAADSIDLSAANAVASGGGLRAGSNSWELEIDPTSTLTKTSGIHTYSIDQLQVTGTPDSGNDAVNKTYVDTYVDGSVEVTEILHGAQFRGNKTVAELNALNLDATEFHIFVSTSADTPTASGSDALTVGSVTQWDGSKWIEIIAPSGGFVPNGTRLALAPDALVSPYSASDYGKIAEFAGSSNTGSLTTLTSDTFGYISQASPVGANGNITSGTAWRYYSVATFWSRDLFDPFWAGAGLVWNAGQAEVVPDSTTGGDNEPVTVGANGVSLDIADIAGAGLTADGSANLAVDLTSTLTKSSGVHTYSPDQLQVSGTPDSGNDAVNKTYVDTAAGGGTYIIEPVIGATFIGNATVATLNGLSLDVNDNDIYVATDAGTPTASGSDTLVIGSVTQWDGSKWIELIAGSGGFVADGVRLAIGGSELPASPYSSPADYGKVAVFDGTSLTGTLSSPASGAMVVIPSALPDTSENPSVHVETQYMLFDDGTGVGSWQPQQAHKEWAGAFINEDAGALDFDSDAFVASTQTKAAGTWTFPVDTLQVTGTPDSGNDAVNKTYVDSLAAGVGTEWREPVATAKLAGNRTITEFNALSPTAGDAYVATSAGTPTAGSSDTLAIGDIAEFDGTSWKLIATNSGGFVPSGVRAILSAQAPLVSPYTDGSDEGKIVDFSGSSNTGADTTEGTIGSVAQVIYGGSIELGRLYSYLDGSWTQINGLGVVTATNGVQKSGDILSLDLLASGGLKLTGTEVGIEPDDIAGHGLEDDGSDNLRLSEPGNGLTGGAGVDYAVQAENTSVAVGGSGVKAAVPSASNKFMTCSVTTSDGDAATATTVVAAPAAGSWIRMVVNGIDVDIRSGSKAGEAYISGDGGTNARTFANVVAGDTIHWNGSVATYELAATDWASLFYVVA